MHNTAIKKVWSVVVMLALVVSLVSCGNNEKKNSGDGNATQAPTSEALGSATPSGEATTIKIGTWYDHYYTSEHTSVDDNPKVSDRETAQMQLDNMRAVEKKYNVKLKFENLTWAGTIESINTSILAGTPYCDIYETDLQFGIPAVMNGFAYALEDLLPADSDIFKDQVVMKYLNIMGQDKNYLFSAQAADKNLGAYPLAFNMDMINEAGLENPQDLYDRGEWTWDKFEEYLKKLTKDTDGDNVTDVYGFGGFWTNTLNQLLMSNGTQIAGGLKTGVNDPATIEVFDFMYKLYNTDKVARPWNADDWDDNCYCYTKKQIAFWPTAAWIMDGTGNTTTLGFEIDVVPWPCGPSGDPKTNNACYVAGNYYMIPSTLDKERALLAYNVFFDWTNWYNGDTELRDDTSWFQDAMVTERNFKYLEEMGEKQQFDIWGALNITDFNMVGLLQGEVTASQLGEQTKQLFQDALDQYFGSK